MDNIYKKSKDLGKPLKDIELEDKEITILLSLDGNKTQTELSQILDIPELEVAQTIVKLIKLQLITPVEVKKNSKNPPRKNQYQKDFIPGKGAEANIDSVTSPINRPKLKKAPKLKVSNSNKSTTESDRVTKPISPLDNLESDNIVRDTPWALLHTKDLVKIYGKRTVVDQVCLQVKQGEIVGLLGPNGAGKTTTFYMITGLISPNKGKIFLNKEDITKLAMFKRARRGIAYLPQEASIFRKLTVEENLLAIMEAINFPKNQRKKRCDELMQELSITQIAKNKGYNLSGGERRRTEIARTLVSNPKFILLDEPFAGVDPIAVEDIQNIVVKLKEKNIGVLITDHNVHETLSITDHAYLLYSGKILKEGNSEYLANDPEARRLYLGDKFQLYR